jgi:hypothetical protein
VTAFFQTVGWVVLFVIVGCVGLKAYLGTMRVKDEADESPKEK